MSTSESKSAEEQPIVLAVDDSRYSLHSLNWLIENVLTEKDKLVLVYSYPVPPAAYMYGGAMAVVEVYSKLNEEALAEAKQMMNHYLNLVKTQKFKTEGFVVEGDPRDVLIDFAEA
eukprot:Colp12_sorted_trinity150504_noHs@33835